MIRLFTILSDFYLLYLIILHQPIVSAQYSLFVLTRRKTTINQSISGKDDKHEQRVGFLVHKDIVKSVIGSCQISSRLMTVRLRASPFNITIIQVYAPISSYDDSDVDEFYRELQSLVDQTPKQDILVVQGDWNAKVREDAQEDSGEVCGPSCNPKTNDRGLKLLDFATYNNLVLANILGKHKPSRRWLWHSPDGTHHNQIDYILVRKRFRSSIKTARTRTFPGADVRSNHDMVMMTFQTRLKNSRKPTQPRIRFDLEKLNDPTVMSAFQATIGGRFAALATLVDEKADLESMVTHFNKLVKDLTTEKQGKSTITQDKSGKCLAEENEILNRLTEYCSDLYNYETDGDPIVLDCPQIPDEEHQPILREEVEAAVKALKMGKSARGEAMIDILTTICNKILKTGEWPTTWTQFLVITLPKKGNLQLCQNYRTISLISHPSKVMLKITLNRLQPQAEEKKLQKSKQVSEPEGAPHNKYSISGSSARNTCNISRISTMSSFDRVWHKALWATMRKYNIYASIIRAIENLYDKAQSAVMFNGSTGEWFRTTVGV